MENGIKDLIAELIEILNKKTLDKIDYESIALRARKITELYNPSSLQGGSDLKILNRDFHVDTVKSTNKMFLISLHRILSNLDFDCFSEILNKILNHIPNDAFFDMEDVKGEEKTHRVFTNDVWLVNANPQKFLIRTWTSSRKKPKLFLCDFYIAKNRWLSIQTIKVVNKKFGQSFERIKAIEPLGNDLNFISKNFNNKWSRLLNDILQNTKKDIFVALDDKNILEIVKDIKECNGWSNLKSDNKDSEGREFWKIIQQIKYFSNEWRSEISKLGSEKYYPFSKNEFICNLPIIGLNHYEITRILKSIEKDEVFFKNILSEKFMIIYLVTPPCSQKVIISQLLRKILKNIKKSLIEISSKKHQTIMFYIKASTLQTKKVSELFYELKRYLNRQM